MYTIKHPIQNVGQSSKKTLFTLELYLLGCAALHDEEQEDHLSNDITLSSYTPGWSKLSLAFEEVIRLPKVTTTKKPKPNTLISSLPYISRLH